MTPMCPSGHDVMTSFKVHPNGLATLILSGV